MKSLIPAVLLSVCLVARAAEIKTFETEHVVVRYAGITEAQANSLGRVAEAARKAALERYGFDVPEQITVNVDCKFGNKVRLSTDGQDTYNLKLRSGFDLAPPAACGIYNLYGMCHELGHVVMYRILKNRDWLMGGAREAWAHCFGSQIVDDVYAAEGENVWWMPYDYRADGMMRLRQQIDTEQGDDRVQAARAWMELTEIVGEKQMPAVFAAWQNAKIDPADPAPAVLAALKQTSDDPRIEQWWARSHALLIFERPRSSFVPRAAAPGAAPAAPGKTTELKSDDGKSAGKRSIAGGGHAVAFEAPADGCRLTSVKIFGSRYGAPQPPAEDFHLYLCDADGKQIQDFPFPYKTFLRGGDRWTTLKLPEPAEIPKNFILCVVFNPAQTKGVYVHHDASLDGDSRVGTPGELNDAFDKGDWMIRALIEVPAEK